MTALRNPAFRPPGLLRMCDRAPISARKSSGTLGRFGVTFTTAVRSREFAGQREPDRYGGLSFSYRP